MFDHLTAPDAGGRSQLEALFDFATIGIVITDDAGNIINFNSFAQAQFGYEKQEVLGRPVELLIPAAARKQHQHYRHAFYADPHPRSMGHGRDLFAQKKDGSVFPVEISLSHYLIEGRIYVISFVIDITVRKESEELHLQQKEELEKVTDELRELNTDLERRIDDRTRMLQEALKELQQSKEELSMALQNEKDLGELKSRFVTMASHEFRTPLSAILSSAYLAGQYVEQNNAAKAGRHLTRIKDAVNNMKNLLEDFLSLGKLEEGYVHATMKRVPVATVFGKIKNTIQQFEQMKKSGQEILIHLESFAADVSIYIDEQLFTNTLINLVTNAIKFSPEDAEINITCNLKKEELQLTVADTGMGISEEDQQHLFRRFFRSKSAANIPGTGLGLHIVAKYIELMRGTITCRSAYEKGTSFTVTIPQF